MYFVIGIAVLWLADRGLTELGHWLDRRGEHE